MNLIKDFFSKDSLFNKIIDWFDPEESNSEEFKTITLKQLTKIPEKIFDFYYSYDSQSINFNPFLTFNKITEFRYLKNGLVNGIVKPSNGIGRIELFHNGIILEIPKHRCIEKKTNFYIYLVEKNKKLKIIEEYKIDCVYFDSPAYPGYSTTIRVYDKDNKKYNKVELISTCCSAQNSRKLLNEYRTWEQRDFKNDRLVTTEIKLFSTQYKSRPINLKPIYRLFQRRYKNKRKILSKYLCKNVIGIICSY